MSRQGKNINVGFLGENLLGNEKVAETLEKNVISVNTTTETNSDKEPGFFDKIKNTFSKKCDCPCDNNKKNSVSVVNTVNATKQIKNTNKNTNTANSKTQQQSSKNCIKLFGSLRNEKGYVVLSIKISNTNNSSQKQNSKQEDIVDGGKLNLNMKTLSDFKKNLPKLSNVKTQINEITKKKNEIIDSIKKGTSNSLKQITGVDINVPSKNSVSTSTTNVKQNSSKQNVNSTTNFNSSIDEPIILTLKVSKTQTESKSDVPASILCILDYLITYKGVEFSKIKTLDEMIEGVMSFFKKEEPQNIIDIIVHCGNVFGELSNISGIKSLCQNNNIITFDKLDSEKVSMNEWDVIKIIYNELVKLNEKSIIDVEFVKRVFSNIKDICGNVQSVNLEKVNRYFINKLKNTIAHQCNNIEALSTKEMETIKQSFIDTICSKDDKYAELASFLVIYLNFFLNELLGTTIEDPQILTILQQQLHFNVNLFNTTDKNIVLYVKPETLKEFLDKFSSDKIIITL
jgi:hypothetical protein